MTSPEPTRVRPPRPEPEDNSPLGWARAIAFGIRDTAKDMLEAGRSGAASGYDEGWKRFDKKTRYRRKPDPNAPAAPARRKR